VSKRIAGADAIDRRSELVRTFYEAFNEQKLDHFAGALHPEVELQTARGLREGREEARAWATKNPGGGLEQTLVLDEVVAEPRGAHALALYRKQWRWRETSELAHSDEMAALFSFRDGLISRWQPFEDRAAARALFDHLDHRPLGPPAGA
jgi:ketosteroid isomerase-like protein